MAETSGALGRTWFGTLTLHPLERARVEMRARTAVGEEKWLELSQEQRTAALATAAGPLVTRYLKRVRAQSGAALRYMLVSEAHEDGTPHFHLLVHEQGGTVVRHAILSRQWVHGYSNWKLVDSAGPAASYVCKYLSKSPLTRVRASVGYGQGTQTPFGWQSH